jgi:hypothetical protein
MVSYQSPSKPPVQFSGSTIHCERLYRKLAVTGRVKLVLRVMEELHALTVSPENNLPPICRNWDARRCPLRRK